MKTNITNTFTISTTFTADGGSITRTTRTDGAVKVTRRDVAFILVAALIGALIGALVAVIVHEREMTTRALVVGLVRCVEARR